MNGTNSSAKHCDMVVISSGAAGLHGAGNRVWDVVKFLCARKNPSG